MFPSVKTRFTSAARRGFDLAIEFATLGEYALAPAARSGGAAAAPTSPAAPAAPLPPPPAARGVPTWPRGTRVTPATPVAVPLHRAPPERRISALAAVRALAF